MFANDFDGVTDVLDYPMFVVTTVATDGRAAGCLVGFATQASIDPPRFLVGLSEKNYTYRVAQDAPRLVVHVLDVDSLELARLFGETTGDDIDKFSRCGWQPGPDGVPVLDGAAAWFSGPVLERMRVGDHIAFLIEVDAAEVRRQPSRLLRLSDTSDFTPGHDA
ncbi:MAG: flavin reductase [Frankiaceae bacterium]|nr:flavin reductase [Frankiaceae bacterium]